MASRHARARRYELHHGVRINDGALVEAAVMSDRYIADRFLPDKAIDLVDEAAAKLKMEITSKPVHLDEIDRKILQLEMERLSLTKARPCCRSRAPPRSCSLSASPGGTGGCVFSWGPGNNVQWWRLITVLTKTVRPP